MKIALLQFDPIVGAIEQNTDSVIRGLQQASSHADLVVTPELSLMGYPPMDLVRHGAVQGEIEAALHRICSATDSLHCGVLVGAPWVVSTGRRRFNSVFLIADGNVQFRWDKQLLPFDDVFYDPRVFVPGAASHVFEWRGTRLGVLICEDAWATHFPDDYEVNPIAQVAAQTPDVVVVPTASPFEVGKNQRRADILAQVAIQVNAPVVMVNQVGMQDDVIYSGASLVINRSGQVIEQLPDFVEAFSISDLNTPTVSPETMSPIAEMGTAIQAAIRGYLKKSGFSSVVLGLSGGIDSAVVASLAVLAVGADNVIGLAMPSEYSSPDSLNDAISLADVLGISLKTLPIHPIYSQYLSQLSWSDTPISLAMENLQSRIRGGLVMAIANDRNALALSTGNKSELAMGYCTLYGDMNGALSPLSDVYKTDVFRLAEWINRDQVIIPLNTITRPPSAELRPNQTDQDSLPDYAVLDAILYAMIEDGKSKDEIVNMGFTLDLVQDISRRCHQNEFKRRQAPMGVKLSRCAFGLGRRNPILSRWPG